MFWCTSQNKFKLDSLYISHPGALISVSVEPSRLPAWLPLSTVRCPSAKNSNPVGSAGIGLAGPPVLAI
jgi:hypothetical protein